MKYAKKISALVILLIMIVAFWTVMKVAFISSYIERNDQISEKLFKLQKLETLSAEQIKISSEVKRADATIYNRGEFIVETSSALASANLQSRLQRAASLQDITLASVRTLPLDENSNLSRIRLTIQLTGTEEKLSKFMHQIEMGLPYLLIENFSLRTSRIQKTSNETWVDSSFDVIAFPVWRQDK